MTDDDVAYYTDLRARIAEKQKIKRRAHYLANKDAYKARAKKWKAANRDKVREAEKLRAREQRAADPERSRAAGKRHYHSHKEERQKATLAWAHARPGVYLYYNAKYRAKRLGLPFDLEKSDIVIPEFCPVLGIPIDPDKRGRGNQSPNSPSVDRIIPKRGYVKGNICVISWRANDLKKDATLAELKALVAYLEAA